MRGVMPALIYLGIGALMHALFVDAQFDWGSAWTWGWLVAWPLMLGFWIIAVAVVVGAIILVWELTTGRI